MTPPRTALYQPWTANMDEGWTRLILENFNFPYTTIHNAEVRAGSHTDRFDCIILPSQSAKSLLEGISDTKMPHPYAGGIGENGAMALERFVEQGGTLVLMDAATTLATDVLHVPVRDVLKDLPREEFMCPASLLRLRVDHTHPLGYGFDTEAAAYFARSRAFEVGKAALKPPGEDTHDDTKDKSPTATPRLSDTEIDAKLAAQQVSVAATYSDNLLLLSGWIFGGEHVRNRTAVCEVQYGKGHIVLLGFRVQFRGQPHGSFKFLFNAIYRSTLADAIADPEVSEQR